jgi:tetratricopeptide (TPR) repeat protein
MTEPETRQPVPETDNSSASTTLTASENGSVTEAEAEVPPEPWTAESVVVWNAYYDIYVMGAALLLVFMVSWNYVTDSQLWLHLRSGSLIADRGAPITMDTFSYTEEGRPWINVPWLFQWVHAAIYKLVYGLVPVNPMDPTANRSGAEQIAVGTLEALSALLRLLTAWMLLKIRHRGPGLWWSALCVTVALGVVFHPLLGIVAGGIALPGTVAPATWGHFLLAFELLVLFRAFFQNRPRALWWLIPIFVLWANIDESFLTGLLILAAAVVGRWLDQLTKTGAYTVEADKRTAAKPTDGTDPELITRPASVGAGFLVLVLGALGCLANPFTYRVFQAAVAPYLSYFRPAGSVTTLDQLSFFSSDFRKQLSQDNWYWIMLYFLALIGLGIGSFLLNVRRFSWTRFLPFVAASLAWGCLMHNNAAFALVLAAVVAPNGQEWYHDRFGTAGRLGAGWTLWSTGGRLVTLTLIFAIMSKDITGWGNTLPEYQFGAGFHQDDFPFSAAEFLERHNEIKGNIFNTSMQQGNVIIWKAAPKRKTYIDGRTRLFPAERLQEWHAIRNALRDDDVASWKPALDKYGITVVLIDPSPTEAPLTWRRLMQSPNWIPFYDDGRIVMFGRADAPASDLAFFKANKLDPEIRAYRVNHPIIGPDRPPTATTWIDGVFQNRTFSRPQSRTESARRWLEGLGPEGPATSAASFTIPEPARCLLAIQEARLALQQSPDDWIAYRRLKDAYRFLMVQEAAMMAGIPITPENRARIQAVQPDLTYLMSRFQQRATALNFAILTTPPPRSPAARQDLAQLNLELFQHFYYAGFRDLARDRLKAMLDLVQPEDFSAEQEEQFRQQLSKMEDEAKTLEEKLVDISIERSATPVDQANFALSSGGTGLAITQLVEALGSSMSPAIVKPRLIDLYCNTGQPDKAQDLLTEGSVDDPNLGAEPGSGALRQGRVYFLLGNYLSAATLWQERAIPRVRFDRTNRVIFAGRDFMRGEVLPSTNTILAVPSSIQQQALWLYDLAMCQLEGGLPEEAAGSFTKALTLAPDMAVRPIAAYYLQKLGKPVPPPRKAAGAATGTKPASSVSPLDPGLLLPRLPAQPSTPGSQPSSEPAAGKPAAQPGKPPTSEPAKSAEPAPKP